MEETHRVAGYVDSEIAGVPSKNCERIKSCHLNPEDILLSEINQAQKCI